MKENFTDTDNNFLEPDEDTNEIVSKDDFEVPEKESEVGELKLSKPFEIDGELVRSIEYDLTAVRPIQYINLIKKLSKKEQIAVPELDINVQMGYFSLASGIPVGDIKRMPNTQDFTAACSLVRNFLLGASDTESMEE